jgi:large subunit ribosomal protein L35Ae
MSIALRQDVINVSSSENIESTVVGVIVGFRTGPRTQHPKQCIIRFSNFKTADEAAKLIGRKVECALEKQSFKGKIVALHGKNGLVKARFRKGLPGQVGLQVHLIG